MSGADDGAARASGAPARCEDAACRQHGIAHAHDGETVVMLAAGTDGWSDWTMPKMHGYKFSCCDCGLTHEVEFHVCHDDGKERVEFRMKRAHVHSILPLSRPPRCACGAILYPKYPSGNQWVGGEGATREG